VSRKRACEGSDLLSLGGGEVGTEHVLAHADPAKANRPAKGQSGNRHTPGPARPDDSAARAGLQEAKKLLRAAEVEEQQAQQGWAKTQRELEQARAAVEKAQRKLDRLRSN
jgi:hypothetical protein